MQWSFKSVSLWGLIIALVAIVVPIVWDNHKSKNEIEIRSNNPISIISKPKRLDGLNITYHNESLDELSTTLFSITNIGNIPISKKDIAVPISIAFPKDACVFDARNEESQPEDLGASIFFNRENSSVVVDFPLLNPVTNFTLGDTSQTVDLQSLRRMEIELERRIRERRGLARTYVLGECV